MQDGGLELEGKTGRATRKEERGRERGKGNRMKRKKKLSRRMTAICGIFVFMLSFTLGLLGLYTYYKNVMELYEQYAETVVRIAAGYIDIKDMIQFIETGTKTEGYHATQKWLDSVKSDSETAHLYVIQSSVAAGKDPATLIWNAVSTEESNASQAENSLGALSGEAFTGGKKEAFSAAMESEDKVTFYADQTADRGYMLTGMYPLRGADGRTVAMVCADISMDEIYHDINQYVVFFVCGTLLVSTVFLLVFLRLVNRGVVSPVVRMAQSTEDFVRQSNSEADPARLIFRDPKVFTGDEIQLLGENLNEMTARLVVYMRDIQVAAREKEHISAELKLASDIKSSMLPNVFPAFPERTEFDIYAKLWAASEMGGDFYDFFLVDKDHLAVLMGNVNGTGVPAALLIVIAQTLLRNYTKLGFGMEKVFTEANNQLSESNEGMTATAFLGILDLTNGTFSYVNAGHNTPLLKHAGGEFELLPSKDCFLLGSMAGVPYWQQSVQMVQGDMLFLYTKGLVEAENRNQVQYSLEHMHMRLNQALGSAYELPEILEVMDRDVKEFLRGQLPKQDITMLLLRYLGM